MRGGDGEWRAYLAEGGSPVPPPDDRPVVLVCDEAGPSKLPEIEWDNDVAPAPPARRSDPTPRPAPTPAAAAA